MPMGLYLPSGPPCSEKPLDMTLPPAFSREVQKERQVTMGRTPCNILQTLATDVLSLGPTG